MKILNNVYTSRSLASLQGHLCQNSGRKLYLETDNISCELYRAYVKDGPY